MQGGSLPSGMVLPAAARQLPPTRVMPPISDRKPPAAMMRARSSGAAGLWSSACVCGGWQRECEVCAYVERERAWCACVCV